MNAAVSDCCCYARIETPMRMTRHGNLFAYMDEWLKPKLIVPYNVNSSQNGLEANCVVALKLGKFESYEGPRFKIFVWPSGSCLF